MNLHICEIVAALSAPGESVLGSTVEQVASVAQPIKLRDVLEEMHMSVDAAVDHSVPVVLPTSGHGNDKSTVVPLAVPQARTLRSTIGVGQGTTAYCASPKLLVR